MISSAAGDIRLSTQAAARACCSVDVVTLATSVTATSAPAGISIARSRGGARGDVRRVEHAGVGVAREQPRGDGVDELLLDDDVGHRELREARPDQVVHPHEHRAGEVAERDPGDLDDDARPGRREDADVTGAARARYRDDEPVAAKGDGRLDQARLVQKANMLEAGSSGHIGGLAGRDAVRQVAGVGVPTTSPRWTTLCVSRRAGAACGAHHQRLP